MGGDRNPGAIDAGLAGMAQDVIERPHVGDPTRSPRRKLGPLVVLLLLVIPTLIAVTVILLAEAASTRDAPTLEAPG